MRRCVSRKGASLRGDKQLRGVCTAGGTVGDEEWRKKQALFVVRTPREIHRDRSNVCMSRIRSNRRVENRRPNRETRWRTIFKKNWQMCWLISGILRAGASYNVAFRNFVWNGGKEIRRIKIPQSGYSDFKRLNYETSGIYFIICKHSL